MEEEEVKAGEPLMKVVQGMQRTIIVTAPYNVEMENQVQTLDVEELGSAAALQAPHMRQKNRIIVDYEENDEYRPELQQEEVACVLSACGPVLTIDSSNGRFLANRRSRCSSSDTNASDVAKGKSVIYKQIGKPTASITSSSNSEIDLDGQTRCSKVPKLCMCEVKLHCSLDSCWLVSSGQVYDVTGQVTDHPGGVRSILRKAGGPDCARDMKFHSKNARKIMEKCFIGKLRQCGDDVDCSTEVNCIIM
ncbi:Cytochrome b5 [Plasmopara halstedii]|uniref:Cytochrome b5 n=1 Tax=Plasmopara halstedii TaxID=4781 RepID=A0A0P1B1F7_PLAHL|nr:Cytochrome b5 [Plasmopara halstedii]CEG47574.1 Cytochrome b5 [Plasmopara halstedii]|eukprot:XP_024583943.1 Cytochrome b5 [Plasmopara halstedii]